MTSRACLDACVLVSATTRALLIGAARAGLFRPVWSEKIFAEWSHAAVRQGDRIAAQTAIEQALLRADFKEAMTEAPDRLDLNLPDPNDVHVLSAAIEARATDLVTANISDFPLGVLSAHGITRRHPDEFLLDLAQSHEDTLRSLVTDALPNDPGPRKTLRKSGLSRLGKFIEVD